MLQNIPCKVHVIITGITCTPEIPAKIIRKFVKILIKCIDKKSTLSFDLLQKLQGLRVYMQSP